MMHVVVGSSHLVVEPHDPAPEARTSAETLCQIDNWLREGKPFFPRLAIRSLYEQLHNPLSIGDTIIVKGLDDRSVAFNVETGSSTPASRAVGLTIGKPFIRYCPYQSLKHEVKASKSPHLAYCPLQIHHYATNRNQLKHFFKTVPETERLFSTTLQVWEESEIWAAVKASISCASSASSIRKVIGLGCGPLSYPDDIPHISYNPAFQHALLLSIQQLLQERFNHEVACAVQDPIYTEVDRSVLESRGVTVLDDPGGFLEVEDSTLVFSCAPNVPVKQIIADIARPAMLIWNTVRSPDTSTDEYLETDPDSPRVVEMIEKFYETRSFPVDEHFWDMAIYVRRDDAAV
ncbi:hypothetical protein BJX99DRAFT_205768 [Aspergillus californicus]